VRQAGLETVWLERVDLLSPLGLRLGLEEVLELVGDMAADGRWLHHYRPDVFWGLAWYCARSRLPSGLLPRALDGSDPDPGGWGGPVIVGWRESVVVAQATRLLRSSNPSSETLALRDVFPRCSREDVEVARKIVACLDGSTVGMRDALRMLAGVPSIVKDAGEGEGGGGARTARSLYVALLTLAFLFQPQLLSTRVSDPPSVLASLGKVCPCCLCLFSLFFASLSPKKESALAAHYIYQN